MQLISKPISIKELVDIANLRFKTVTKAVVDIEKNIMMVDADMHADQEKALLKQNSQQKNLWGINLYPQEYKTDNFIEFDSMINLRPSWGNNTRDIDNQETKDKITEIVLKLITD